MQSIQGWMKERPARMAMAAALLSGTLVHAFCLFHFLHNHDSIWQQISGYGVGVESGRWLLSLLGDVMEKLGFSYSLPVFNGVGFLILLACAAGLAVSVLRIHGKISAVLLGMLFTAFPSVTSVMFYKFTAVYYGLGLFLAVLAAWVCYRGRWGIVLAAVCVACSMGIYQAYVPLTISLIVLLLLKQALVGEDSALEILFRGLYGCGALLLGVVLYFCALKGCLLLYHTQLNDYQGINQMGQISLSQMPELLVRTYRTFLLLPAEDTWGIANTGILKVVYFLLELLGMGMVAGLAAVKVRKLSNLAIVVCLCAVFPAAVNFITIMCPEGQIHTLMVFGFVWAPAVPVVFAEDFQKAIFRKGSRLLVRAAYVLMGVLIFCYGYGANVHYSAMYYANRQVENYCSSLVTQVRMTEGFDTEKKWAFLGDISDPLLNSPWREAMVYGGHCFTNDLLNQYSRMAWFENYIGYDIPLADSQTVDSLAQREDVKQMPCWPDQGSIQVIGEYVVIKFSETGNS